MTLLNRWRGMLAIFRLYGGLRCLILKHDQHVVGHWELGRWREDWIYCKRCGRKLKLVAYLAEDVP